MNKQEMKGNTKSRDSTPIKSKKDASRAGSCKKQQREGHELVKQFMMTLEQTYSFKSKRDQVKANLERRERKRQINRLSAQRKRYREREEADTLSVKLGKLSKANDALRKDNDRLEKLLYCANHQIEVDKLQAADTRSDNYGITSAFHSVGKNAFGVTSVPSSTPTYLSSYATIPAVRYNMSSESDSKKPSAPEISAGDTRTTTKTADSSDPASQLCHQSVSSLIQELVQVEQARQQVMQRHYRENVHSLVAAAAVSNPSILSALANKSITSETTSNYGMLPPHQRSLSNFEAAAAAASGSLSSVLLQNALSMGATPASQSGSATYSLPSSAAIKDGGAASQGNVGSNNDFAAYAADASAHAFSTPTLGSHQQMLLANLLNTINRGPSGIADAVSGSNTNGVADKQRTLHSPVYSLDSADAENAEIPRASTQGDVAQTLLNLNASVTTPTPRESKRACSGTAAAAAATTDTTTFVKASSAPPSTTADSSVETASVARFVSNYSESGTHNFASSAYMVPLAADEHVKSSHAARRLTQRDADSERSINRFAVESRPLYLTNRRSNYSCMNADNGVAVPDGSNAATVAKFLEQLRQTEG